MMNRALIIVTIAVSALNCKKPGNSELPPPEPKNPGAISLFPKPPTGWAGTTDPYPTTGWVGDVMPYFNDGQFEVFFLHDATNQIKAQSSGEHPIHKFTSSNLVDFQYGGEMIPYGSASNAEHLLGTGSVVKSGDMYFFYYTGHNGRPGWVANNPREVVLYATSSDLNTWTKNQSFKLMASTLDGYDRNEFRDPHVFYNEEFEEYWMLMSTRRHGRGVLALYTTDDPTSDSWALQEPLEIEGDYLMLECADIFKMGDLYYLLFAEDWSSAPGTRYRVAHSSKGPWKRPEGGNDMFDGHQFYAGKTATDETNRYVFAWAHRRQPENDNGQRTWAGNLVVHEITRQADGRLGVKSPDAVTALFSEQDALSVINKTGDVTEHTGSFVLNGASSAAHVVFNPLNGTQLIDTKLSLDNTSGTVSIFFNADESASETGYEVVFVPENSRISGRNMGQEVTRVPLQLQSGRTYDVKIIVEESICILYIDGEAALTNRIYGLQNRNWGVKATGLSASLTELKIQNTK